MAEGWLIIANPVSGGGRAKRVGEQVLSFLQTRGLSAELAFTTAPGDGERLVRSALDRGVRQIAVCGGDGSIHEAINGLAGSNGVLGIVPCGRGNDFARALGIPKKIKAAVEVLVNGQNRQIDLSRIGHRYFGTVACLGFDAEVSRATRKGSARLGATVSYVSALLKELVRYQCPAVRLEGDFGIFEGDIFLTAMGNTPFYGSGIQIAPGAKIDDGLLTVCLVKSVSRQNVLLLLPKVYSGGHIDHPAVQMLQTRSLIITAKDDLWLFADGEPIGQTPATVEIVPNVLTVRVL